MLSIRNRPEDIAEVVEGLGLSSWFATLSVAEREVFEECSRRARKMLHGQIFGASPTKGFLVHAASSALKGQEMDLAVKVANHALDLDGSQVDQHDAFAILIRAHAERDGPASAVGLCQAALDSFDRYDPRLRTRLRREIAGQLPMRDVLLAAVESGRVARDEAEGYLHRLVDAELITEDEAEAHWARLEGRASITELEPPEPEALPDELEEAIVEDVVDEPSSAEPLDAAVPERHPQVRTALEAQRYEEAVLLAEHALADTPDDAELQATLRTARLRLLHAKVDSLPGPNRAPAPPPEVLAPPPAAVATARPRVIIA